MPLPSATEIGKATLISNLSGKPVNIRDDLFAWNNIVLDKDLAVVSLLKLYNQVPVSSSVKISLYTKYNDRFADIKDRPFFVGWDVDGPLYAKTVDITIASSIWFSRICNCVRGDVMTMDKGKVKEILVTLHS
jgi:hypothetical protein